MKFLNFLVLLTIVSCSNGEVNRNVEHTTYVTSGVEQFILAEVPNWANFSTEGKCYKSSSFQYLDFSKASLAYKLNYHELIELQAQYNEKLENYFKTAKVRFLKPVEESSFFSNTLEQVRSGIYRLKLPNVSEVDVIWLESYIKENRIADLVKFMQSDRYAEKLPILFSSCFSRQVMNEWITQNALDQVGFYIISAEWLSPFSSDLKPIPGIALDLKELIDPKIKVNVITAGGVVPTKEIIYKKGEE